MVASERRDAEVEVVVFECHSNVEYPGLEASCSPHKGSFRIDPLSASLKIVSTCWGLLFTVVRMRSSKSSLPAWMGLRLGEWMLMISLAIEWRRSRGGDSISCLLPWWLTWSRFCYCLLSMMISVVVAATAKLRPVPIFG